MPDCVKFPSRDNINQALLTYIAIMYLHTYIALTNFFLEGVTEASKIYLGNQHILP
jgi:hypothetical protein